MSALTFLSANLPLTKTISLDAAGVLSKSPYPNVYKVTSHTEPLTDIASLHKAILNHAAKNHCLLKGNVTRTLVDESRAGTTDAVAATNWLCLDIDGLPVMHTPDPSNPKPISLTPTSLLRLLGMGDVSYVLQWSASQGLPTSVPTLRCHIYLLLDRPVPAPWIKQWLIHLNHTIPLLREAQKLTKTGNAISWALDVTTCQNDKLLYIAPPLFKGMKNPLGRTPRTSLVTLRQPCFQFPSVVPATDVNRDTTLKRIAELRNTAGLPPRKFTTRLVNSHEVLSKPEPCTVTGIRDERGFRYFNFNNGDSWGYFHPEDKPDIIYNFKDEPKYLTKELLPSYWAEITAQASRTSSSGITYLAFLDRRTSAYYRGTYEASTDTLDLHPAKNETQIRHFAEQYGVPLGSYIAEWDMTFDPNDNVRVDFTNKTINLFQPSEYMRAPARKVTQCPPTIFQVIHHALGSDADCTAHFINWLSFIVQKRTRTLTAWVLHGVEGTGKGILMNRILRPLLGKNQTTMRRMEELNEQYNAFMRSCFLVFVDEVEAAAFVNGRGVMAKLRNFITEEYVTIRAMYSNAVEWLNYTNWIFASNRPEPVVIPSEDRRFNVGRYQPVKLVMTDQELARIPGELQDFHDFLLSYPLDLKAVATVLDNDDRTAMIQVSQSSVDTVATALLSGDMEFLLDQLPATMAYSGHAAKINKIEDYKHALKSIMLRTNLKTGATNISRDELHAIFDYVVGGMPDSPNKFTSLLKHHRIRTTKVWCDNRAVYGVSTRFKDVHRFDSYVAMHFGPPVAAPGSAPKTKTKVKA